MRSLFTRLRWVLLTVIVLALVAVMAAADISLLHRGRGPSPQPPEPASAAPLEMYRGLGSWVDVFDYAAWRNPAGVVSDMASHGVRTLYIETATTHSSTAFVDRAALSAFITQAHAHHMYVVAWYPPSMRSGSTDYDRIIQAVEFRTGDGQKFDSVALDIESTAVKPVGVRNAHIAALSRKIRSRVGSTYPLGAIIPSPVGLRKQTGFWNVFPYTALASIYDVFLPMGYYTYHTRSGAGAYADTAANMRIIRSQAGCTTIPVHMIGGLAGSSTPAEVLQFATAARKTGCIGASLYDWAGMSAAKWRQLAAGWGAETQ